MGQKVWVIDDPHWKEAPIRSQLDEPASAWRPTDNRPLVQPPQKSPAVSFSLSLLVWGSGQMYIGEYGPGSIFMAAMLFFYSTLSGMVFFRHSASRIIAEADVSRTVLVVVVLAFVTAGLIVWLANAVHAYYRAARLRPEPFPGVDNEFCPLFCSLFFPGWGQFLNGQPKKGSFFLLFGLLGTFSVVICSVARYAWPVLKSSPARLLSESSLAAALLLIPISFLMWIVATYDSFGSRRELARKRQRSQLAGYRAGGRGVVRNLIPRSTAVLCLLLAISVGMQSVPKNYYRDSLERIRVEALNLDMEIIPELIRKVNNFIDR